MGKKSEKIIVFLFLLVLTLSSCSYQSTIPNYTPLPKEDNSVACDEIRDKYDDSIDKYNNLLERYNQVIAERNAYWDKYQTLNQLVNICNMQEISTPKHKTLHKVTFCNSGCDYNLYCTSSMKPFFDCTDKLTFYTNVKEDEIEVCDIIAFESPEYPSSNSKPYYTIHRVVKIDKNGYTAMGIANIRPDDYVVKFSDIKGKLISIEYS